MEERQAQVGRRVGVEEPRGAEVGFGAGGVPGCVDASERPIAASLQAHVPEHHDEPRQDDDGDKDETGAGDHTVMMTGAAAARGTRYRVTRLMPAPEAQAIAVAEPALAAHPRAWPAVAVVAALTAVGVALRLAVAGQSVFADELSTSWIVGNHDLPGVVSVVHGDREITPPLYFVLAWLATRIARTPELLRAPALVAGAAAIPLVYLIGVRSVGLRAALVAAALTALSPFMVYYSAEARGYQLMVALVLASTLALLLAVDSGHLRWWIVYAAASCAAVYSHYTSAFALAAQLVWVLWAHPQARRPALAANAGAVVAFLPWLSGFRGDLRSPTTDILSALQPFTAHFVRTSLEHWAIGYPYATPVTGLRELPGDAALVLLASGLVLAALGLVITARQRHSGAWRLDRRVVLVLALAVSVPLGEALASALSSNLFGTRNLAASWPAFALCLAAFLVAAGRRLGIAAATLAIVAFAIGAAKMLDPDFARPDYRAVADVIDRRAAAGDVVLDGASIAPAGMPGALDDAFQRSHTVLHLGRDRVRYDPFRILSTAPPTAEVVNRAVAVAAARGGRIFLAVAHGSTFARDAGAALARSYRPVEARSYPGIIRLDLLVYAPRG